MSQQIAIYVLKHPETRQVFYVGATSNIATRYKSHLSSNQNPHNAKNQIIRSLKSHGMKPIMEVVCVCDYQDSHNKENEYIQLYKDQGCLLVNVASGGGGLRPMNTHSNPLAKYYKMTIDMPIELHTALKIEAAKRQQSMTEFIIAAIKRELAQPTATQDTHAVYAADGDG